MKQEIVSSLESIDFNINDLQNTVDEFFSKLEVKINAKYPEVEISYDFGENNSGITTDLADSKKKYVDDDGIQTVYVRVLARLEGHLVGISTGMVGEVINKEVGLYYRSLNMQLQMNSNQLKRYIKDKYHPFTLPDDYLLDIGFDPAFIGFKHRN